jgi:hypothetical protein
VTSLLVLKESCIIGGIWVFDVHPSSHPSSASLKHCTVHSFSFSRCSYSVRSKQLHSRLLPQCPPPHLPAPSPAKSKADAWLFEHSKFLRKHFSPNGPADIPSKHDLIQERASGEAFPRETKIDAALFGHSRFLRKRFKHEENVQGGIKSKSRMLRESLDGQRSNGMMEQNDSVGDTYGQRSAAAEVEQSDKTQDVFQDAPIAAATPREGPHDEESANGLDHRNDIPVNETPEAHTKIPSADQDTARSSSVPAWAAVQDNARSYSSVEPFSAVAGVPKAGLIEHHPTTMESTPVTGRPVPHSLLSNTKLQDRLPGTGEETRPLGRESPVSSI